MTDILKRAWSDMLRPILQRPRRIQVAALCYRQTDLGKQVLMITSRDTHRWILPKGWPIDGHDCAGSALQEAWEEAGVKSADIDPKPIGQYSYQKGLGGGLTTEVDTQVYATSVRDLSDTYPESYERSRRWVTPKDAANMVDEPELREILRAF